MTLREWIFLLFGTVVGSGIAPLFRRLSSLDFSRKRESAIPPRAQEVGVETEKLSPPPAQDLLSNEQLEVEMSPWHFKFKLTSRRLVAFGFVLLLALAGWFVARLNVKPPQIESVVPSDEEPLFSDMQRGVDRELYSVKPDPNNEVVSGLKGRYYYVDLKRADSQRTLLFKPKEYIKDEFLNDFRESMEAFRSDILQHVDNGKIPYRLFVRGSADKAGDDLEFLATRIEGDERQIRFLPRLPENPNRYGPQEEVQDIPKKYANRHLPNLRAAYVQEKLEAYEYKATILQGAVTDQISEKDRCAVMLLYVDWPKKLLDGNQ
jgi:hypothetical protein